MDEKSSNVFFLKAVDPATRSIALEARFEVASRSELRELLDMPDNELTEEHATYDLESHQVTKIVSHYRLTFEPGSMPVSLYAWHPIDDRPYTVHTDRELALMLAGTKPLAAFVDIHPSMDDGITIPEREFEPHVKAGLIIKHEHIEAPSPSARLIKGQRRGIRRILYALRGEEWRINAFLLLWKTADLSGWNEGFERMEGSLLGYEDWQNDFHINEQRARLVKKKNETK